MDFEIPQNITFTTDGVSWGPSSSQSEDLDELLAFFDCACANSEPLDATEFAKAQGLGMMREFHYIQNSIKEVAPDTSCFELHTDDQDQSSSVNSGAVTEESGGRQTPSRTVVDGPTVIANSDRATGPKVKALSISQVTALGIEPMSPERPELAMTHVTAFEVPPKVAQVPVLAMSQVITLDLKAKLLETSNVIISPIKTLDLSHTPNLETSQADIHNPSSISASTTEVLMPHPLSWNRSEPGPAASHTISSVTNEASQSRTERMDGSLGSFDHPIVISDGTADEELERELAEDVDQPFVDMDRCKELQQDKYLQQDKQLYPRRTNGRMISNRKRTGVVQWDQYEQNILCELQRACHLQGAYWGQVRDLPDLATYAKVQQHDTLVRRIVETTRNTRTMLPIDTDELRKSYKEMRHQILPDLNEEGKHLLNQLSQTLDVVYNCSEIASTIQVQYRLHDDKKDGTYRPSKRQRRL